MYGTRIEEIQPDKFLFCLKGVILGFEGLGVKSSFPARVSIVITLII